MKIFPVITALLVSAVLYLIVFERDQLLGFARSSPEEAAAEDVAEEEVDADALPNGVGVVAIHSVAQTIDSAVVMRGRTEAAREVTVAAETTGRMISEPLRKGAFVNEGDVLCRLDPGTREASLLQAQGGLAEAEGRIPEAEAALAEANARVREAEINLNAARRLSADGYTSETQLVASEASSEAALAGVQSANATLVSARAGIQAAQAAVAAAELEIANLAITAPFSGLLETDTAELGSLMQQGTSCATIIQLDPIKMVGYVPETDVGKVSVGAAAQARLVDGKEVEGRVTFVSRRADDTTRTFQVEVTVPNEGLVISDGETAEIIVGSDGRLAHLIPQSAMTLNDDGALGVRTIDGQSTAQFIPITLLRDTAEGAWVTDLPDTADIIVVGQEFVVDGVTVNPTFKEAKG